ncbi:MAG TPA: DEAD/DEAH box helicase [Longimicrobiales bacterium]|nr:DEAD/DEAH box helicase [Longimicrobiales bacterium]
MVDFNRFGLSADVLRAISDLEFTKPTPIQTDAIPHAMAGRDLLACASTGSGKTAAFLLPILERLRLHKTRGTRALIITPTRELAAQIVEHAKALGKHTKVKSAAVYGGVGMKPQEDAFRRGVDIIVATPGRLLDHMQYNYVDFSKLEVLVLDEADRMLDMGFLPDVRRILKTLPAATSRQTLFFSATMPPQIAELSREMLNKPASINIERKSAPAKGITQALYPVPQKLKADLLVALLKAGEIGNVIVFTRTKHRANRLFEKLERSGISATRMHGNRSQSQRTDALAGFKSGKYQVLVATDIVARGIDVEALDHVVNFDPPASPDDYIHRVGRTARAEATGDAFTFYAPEEKPQIRAIERVIGRSIPQRTLKGFDYDALTTEKLEIPIEERVKAIREKRKADRARSEARARGEIPAKTGQPHRKRRGRPAASGEQSRSSRERSR